MPALNRDMTNAIVAVALADLAGVSLLIFSFFLYQRTDTFLARAWPAPGVVVGFERGGGDAAQTAPVVRFETNRGQEQRFRADLYVAWRDYGMGDAVPVLYDPKAPADARIDDSLLLWMAPMTAGAFGLILILGSTGALGAAMFQSLAAVKPPRPGAQIE